MSIKSVILKNSGSLFEEEVEKKEEIKEVPKKKKKKKKPFDKELKPKKGVNVVDADNSGYTG
jgi:hypothetical protein